ncbi:MAG: Hint domain-containing protein [Rhodobacteraceae bacterium]|nr:Hint domain-containing protein [Paracoccaceae bacterium]MCW9044061.1 Hint domain-containing protein [Pseudopelagicola sp.]
MATINGSGGNDSLNGTGSDDTINAYGGNDTLSGGAGNDSISGGTGNDEIIGSSGADTFSGGSGQDTINYSDSASAVTVDLSTNNFSGGDAENDVNAGGIDAIIGSDHDDVLTGYDGESTNPSDAYTNEFWGGAGNDTLDGRGGGDYLDGGADNDVIDGASGHDTITGGAGDDTIDGGSGNDLIGEFSGPELLANGSFEDGTHSANGVNGLDNWSNVSGSPDSADDGTNAEYWNPALDASDGTGYITMWSYTDRPQEAMAQSLNDPLQEGQTYSLTFNAQSTDYEGGQWFTPQDIPVKFEILDQNGNLLGETIVQGTDYESYEITFTAPAGVTGIQLRPNGSDDPTATYPAVTLDEVSLVATHDESGNDVIDGGTGNDTIFAGDGNDSITAGTGTDSVDGGSGQDTILGGGDNDTLSGGDDDDYIKIDSIGTTTTNTTVLGGSGGNDNDTLDLSSLLEQGFVITNMTQTPESNGNAGFSGQIQLYNASTGQTANINYEDIETFVPCFTPGTLIATARGECPVEDLRVGDRVVTRDNGLQEIRWVGRRDLSEAELALTPHLRPVLIRAGSLGENLPDRDMHVSPNHRMLLAEDRSVLYFDEYEVLAAAKHLTHRSGVDTLPRGGVSYLHFMCDRHEIVLGDNAWSESFQPGDQSLGSMRTPQRDEIFELFPELETCSGRDAYTAARMTLKRHEARLLA